MLLDVEAVHAGVQDGVQDAAQCGGMRGGARVDAVSSSAKYVVPSPEFKMEFKMPPMRRPCTLEFEMESKVMDVAVMRYSLRPSALMCGLSADVQRAAVAAKVEDERTKLP